MLATCSKLKIAHKLAIAACAFIVPVAFLLWALVTEQAVAIRFAAKEVDGGRYLTGLVALQERSVILSLSGASGAQPLADAVSRLLAAHGTGLQTSGQAAVVIAAMRDSDGCKPRARSCATSSCASATART